MVNQLEGEIPKEMGQLEALQELRLSDNRLSGEIPAVELGNLRRLKLLSLANNKLNGSIPKELGELKSLQQLRLQSNNRMGEDSKGVGQSFFIAKRAFAHAKPLEGTYS